MRRNVVLTLNSETVKILGKVAKRAKQTRSTVINVLLALYIETHPNARKPKNKDANTKPAKPRRRTVSDTDS